MKKLTPERWLYYSKDQLRFFNVLESIKTKDRFIDLHAPHLTFATSHAMRGVLIYHDVEFGRKFYLSYLIRVFDQHKIKIPNYVREAAMLDKYEKISLGFPYPPVTKDEMKESKKLARDVYKWAKGIIKKNNS